MNTGCTYINQISVVVRLPQTVADGEDNLFACTKNTIDQILHLIFCTTTPEWLPLLVCRWFVDGRFWCGLPWAARWFSVFHIHILIDRRGCSWQKYTNRLRTISCRVDDRMSYNIRCTIALRAHTGECSEKSCGETGCNGRGRTYSLTCERAVGKLYFLTKENDLHRSATS